MSKVNTIIIDEQEYNLGGGAARVNAELYVYATRTGPEGSYEYIYKLFLRAPKDTINPETDVLEFARKKVMADRLDGDTEPVIRRRKGWIRPLPYNDITLRYVKDEEFSTDTMDYFEILPSVNPNTFFTINGYGPADGVYDSWVDLADNIREFKDDYFGAEAQSLRPASIGERCGICVERDGQMITDYLMFSVKHSQPDNDVIGGIAVTI